MANQSDAKTDAAIEKPAADAGAKKTDAKTVDVAKVAEAVEADAPAKPAEAKAPAEKAARKSPATRTAATKTAARRKPAARKPAFKKSSTEFNSKETKMTDPIDFTASFQDGFAKAQERARAAYEKGAEFTSEMNEFSKGNLEAMVESARIYAAGVQEIAKGQMEDAKTAAETMTSDVKGMAAVKSPTELVQLHGELASRNFDATVAHMSKATEAWVKLANDAFAPLSSRASIAMEKVRTAA